MLRRTLMILLSGAAAAGLGAPAARAASTADYLGVNLQPMMKDTNIVESRWDSFMAPLQAGQMTVSRVDINWFLVEAAAPVNGVHTYDWNAQGRGPRGSIDAIMTEVARFGIRAVPTFTAPPPWVVAGSNRLPDARFGDFAAFVAAFATRYGPGGAFWAQHPELPTLPVTEYEIWNEANSNNSWTGGPDPAAYARLLSVVYPAVKAVQPGVRVLASIGWPGVDAYLSALWAGGAGAWIDAIGFHPYAPQAQEIINLTTRLRTTLGRLGRPDLPILITETGQAVTYTGPGSAHAYSGPVSDATRAATMSLAADALGRSDCGVQQFLVYAVTGSETNREVVGEGFMGVLRYADGTPNVTGAALQLVSRRWNQFVASGGFARGRLALCSPAPTPDAALLPLDLSVQRSANGCAVGTVGYDGHPLESATLTLTTPDGRTQALQVDAFGRTEVCVPNGPATPSFDVTATVPKAARSAVYRCFIPGPTCQLLTAAPGQPAVAPTCTLTLKSSRPRRLRASVKSAAKVRAKITCPQVAKGSRLKFVVGLKRVGHKKESRLRTLTLRNAKTVRFTAKAKIRKGDRVTLLHRPDPATGLPRLRQTVKLKAPR